jgi:hypothetical protein
MAGSATLRANASYWRGGRSRNRGTIAAVLSGFCAGPCRRQRRYRCARMGRYAGCSGRGIAPSGGQWVSPVPDSNVRILVEGTAVRLAAPRDRRFESIGEPDLEHSLAVGPTRALHHRAPPEGGAKKSPCGSSRNCWSVDLGCSAAGRGTGHCRCLARWTATNSPDLIRPVIGAHRSTTVS